MRERVRHFLNGFHDTTMFLALMLWVCLAPFVLFFTVPFFGWQAGLAAVLIAFFVVLALCWGVCVFPKIFPEDNLDAT